MKNLIVGLCMVIFAGFATGCTSETSYGNCVGLGDDSRDPALHYEVDVWNAILGVVFVETIVVPVWIGAKEIYCPVGRKVK